MKIFIICPVRNVEPEIKEKIENYVRILEFLGHEVYYPPRDTDQNDSVGFRICMSNKEGILWANEVHVAWDEKSEGFLFDGGMAFMAGKKVRIIEGIFPEATVGKSFASMVRYWAKQ